MFDTARRYKPTTHTYTQEVEGTNIFDLVETGSHNRLRRLLEENLGSVSKEAIASALRHQGTTFESLLARAEKAKEQGDSGFFTMSGEAPRFPGPIRTGRRGGGSGSGSGSSGGSGSGAGDMGGSTDDWESEAAASLAGESQGRTTGASSTSGGGGVSGGGSSGGSSSGGGGGRKTRRGNTVGSSGSGGMSDSSSGGGGAGGAGAGKGKDAWAHRRSFPPLGPPAFSVVASGEKVSGGPAAAAAAARGGAQSGGGANGAPGGAKAREVGGAARKLELCSDAQGESAGGGGGVPISGGSDGGGGGGGKASMVNVDRDLQSKINAFTNTQKVSESVVGLWFSVQCCGTGVGLRRKGRWETE